jgi:hypothetical protein
MMTHQFSPSAPGFLAMFERAVDKIRPGHRVQVLIPKVISHSGIQRNWNTLEDIQMRLRGSFSNPNTFATFRFDKKDEAGEVMIDIHNSSELTKSAFELTLPTSEFSSMLRKTLKKIHPGHRAHVLVPRNISHWDNRRNWAVLEEIQMSLRGSSLNNSMFVTFRFDEQDEAGDVTIDIYNSSS